jgi:hypothetical protein
MMKEKELVELLINALEKAKNHLEYCGYGDKWEREIALDNHLPTDLEIALEAGYKYINNKV